MSAAALVVTASTPAPDGDVAFIAFVGLLIWIVLLLLMLPGRERRR